MPAAPLSPSALSEAERALEKSLLFQGLSAHARADLARRGRVTTLPAGAVLFVRGDPGDFLYLVLEGELEARRVTRGGVEVRLAALAAGAMIGEMAVLDGGGRSADVVALRPSKLLRFPRALIQRVLEQEPGAALAIARELSVRLRATDAALEDGQVLDLAGRLAELLLQAVGERDSASLSQAEMARRIAASREKVNRKLGDWSRDGVVSVTRAGVRIVRPDVLRNLVTRQRS